MSSYLGHGDISLYLLLIQNNLFSGCTVERSFETKTVAVGENVALICRCGPYDTVFWIRPVSGKPPEFYKTFSSTSVDPRIQTTEESGTFVLRIRNATQSDTGVYYCLKIENKNSKTFLKGVDLKVQGKYITEKKTKKDSPQRNVSTASSGTSAPLMQRLVTVLLPHVGRYLDMEQNPTLKVAGEHFHILVKSASVYVHLEVR
uniref:Ig-like domain-containing protein n=1 Tax=Sparus aurata TaxID=8175 RepID=A0A671XXN8_SPAAU